MPLDSERWQEPITEQEADLYCDNGIDCITCHYCTQLFIDEYPQDYVCDSATFRAGYLNPHDSSQPMINKCGTKVGYTINNKCEETRYIQKVMAFIYI